LEEPEPPTACHLTPAALSTLSAISIEELQATARPRREQTAKSDPVKQRRPEAQEAGGRAHRAFARSDQFEEMVSRRTLEPRLSKRAANPTVRQDRGYGVTSALALVVEAVEALALPLRL
jgi:hypothetical protein